MDSKASTNLYQKYKKHIPVALLMICAFGVGLLIPSPLFRKTSYIEDFGSDEVAVRDTTNMVLQDGSIYEGSINAKTNAFQGYGVLKKGSSTYEGNWRDGRLPYGKRTTKQSIYEGRFDKNLNNDGFGIIRYTPEYVAGKRKQGRSDKEITSTYVGNWKNNVKSGIGRSVMVSGNIEFGKYEEGILKRIPGAKFEIGDHVYGIDVSRHQIDIDWNNLALYCNADGDVFRGKPAEKKYMQPVFFVYIKATEGATVKDKTFDVRMIEAERHGITKGAYHFLRLGSPIEDQIKNFTETATWTKGDLPPALDVEVESEIAAHGVGKLLDMTYKWLEAIETKMGVRPIIYTREDIRDKYLAKDPRFNKYKCWIARYHPNGPKKQEWQFWQMTENGHLNGYKGGVDIDLFKGDYQSFTKYLDEIALK